MPWSIRTACRCELISAGQASDKAAVEALIDGHKLTEALAADRGYDARAVIDMIQAHGGRAHIPHPARPEGPALHRPGDRPAAEYRRAIRLKVQALPTHRGMLRQTGPQLPRRRLARLSLSVAQRICVQNLASGRRR